MGMNRSFLVYLGASLSTIGGIVAGFAYSINSLITKIIGFFTSLIPITALANNISQNASNNLSSTILGTSIENYYLVSIILIGMGFSFVAYGSDKKWISGLGNKDDSYRGME
jgi:hypothetical protein